MIKIKLSERANDICIKAIKAVVALYDGDVKPTIDILRSGFTKPASFNESATKGLMNTLEHYKIQARKPKFFSLG